MTQEAGLRCVCWGRGIVLLSHVLFRYVVGYSSVEIVRSVATDISWRISYSRFIMGMHVSATDTCDYEEKSIMLSKYNWMSLVTGLLLIAAAIYMFADPATPLVVLGYVFSFAVLLGGVFEVVRYFGTPKQARTGWDLVDGILTVVAGLILLSASAGAQATYIPTIVGVWLIAWALIRLMTAQAMKYLSYAAGRHLQFSAIGTLILGLLVLLFPMIFGVAAVWMAALGLLVTGLVFVGDFFVSRRTKSTVHISPDGAIDIEAR
ncbi:hypothetical protein HMPREF2528_08085 [Rothia sp. HMSC078H08]|nr:hypothetical protein HMPREF2528_08085 [Rothia sp. HMSC078H08]